MKNTKTKTQNGPSGPVRHALRLASNKDGGLCCDGEPRTQQAVFFVLLVLAWAFHDLVGLDLKLIQYLPGILHQCTKIHESKLECECDYHSRVSTICNFILPRDIEIQKILVHLIPLRLSKHHIVMPMWYIAWGECTGTQCVIRICLSQTVYIYQLSLTINNDILSSNYGPSTNKL